MNCRGCGRPIPERYLKLDNFECPYCGRRYHRTAAPARRSAPAQRQPTSSTRSVTSSKSYRRSGQRRQESAWDKIKAALTRRVWKLPVFAYAIVAIVLVLSIVGIYNAMDNTKEAGEAMVEWATDITPFNEDVDEVTNGNSTHPSELIGSWVGQADKTYYYQFHENGKACIFYDDNILPEIWKVENGILYMGLHEDEMDMSSQYIINGDSWTWYETQYTRVAAAANKDSSHPAELIGTWKDQSGDGDNVSLLMFNSDGSAGLSINGQIGIVNWIVADGTLTIYVENPDESEAIKDDYFVNGNYLQYNGLPYIKMV